MLPGEPPCLSVPQSPATERGIMLHSHVLHLKGLHTCSYGASQRGKCKFPGLSADVSFAQLAGRVTLLLSLGSGFLSQPLGPVSGPLQSHFFVTQQSLRHLPHPIPCMILHHPQVASFTITTHARSALNCRSCALKLRASKLSAHLLPPHPFAPHLPGRAKAKK